MHTNDQESVLVLNGSHSEIPLILAARELGYRVITSGSDPGGRGHAFGDEYVPADFSDVSAITVIAADHRVSGVISACNDFAAITAAYVSRNLGLPGHDDPGTCRAIHHKDLFRAHAKQINLPSISSINVNVLDPVPQGLGDLRMPVIVKPIDLSGGKGMTICASKSEIGPAIMRARAKSRATHVVVEEFLEGTNHGFTTFIQDRKVVWWFADDEQYFANPFLVAGTSTPSSLPSEAIAILLNSVEALARWYSLTNGLVHLQCILTNGVPHILEASRRCPGDLYPEFIRYATSWHYAKTVVLCELGRMEDSQKPPNRLLPTVRHCAMASRNGTYKNTDISPNASSELLSRWPVLELGDEIIDFQHQKSEILFFRFADDQAMRAFLRDRESNVHVAVEDSMP